MRCGVVVFPGSNCDHDCYHVLKHVMGWPVDYIWHKQKDLKGYDLVLLPGGFSYGDYLRAGAIARFSPIMNELNGFAEKGGLVLGICNGFQVLLESGLLPGAMLMNRGLRFICRYVHIRVENNSLPFTGSCKKGQALHIPIAHQEGCYYNDPEAISEMEKGGQVVFRYCSPESEIDDRYNPNGSSGNIAGVCNRQGNVLGMMPHPERCSEAVLGSEDGRLIFSSLLKVAEGVSI
ncbi:phosphoribosylformylglycinamidine synthase subunit PurQ [bacterium]|nr:phosphoribosylformylglycinamidine synthase subunit PurQ [bacterium]